MKITQHLVVTGNCPCVAYRKVRLEAGLPLTVTLIRPRMWTELSASSPGRGKSFFRCAVWLVPHGTEMGLTGFDSDG